MLAIVGALTLLSIGATSLADRFGDAAATGTVENEDGTPAVHVPVFLDRGIIERYITDSAGNFRLPLSRHTLRPAVWLICAPKALPMVGHDRPGIWGGTTYTLNSRDVNPGTKVTVRGFGWSAPIPRECTLADSTTYWRGPVDSANAPVPVLKAEPDWTTYRSQP